MIRKYSLVIEGDDAGYSGYVPELPTILVTGKSMEELTASAKEAVRLYLEALHTDRSPASTVREIEVELPA
jgi:predicted RNase H-like HicB family nuclease